MLAIYLLLKEGRVHTRWWSREGLRNAAQIDDDGFDTVAFAFDLGLKTLHFVAIKRVGDILLRELAKGGQFLEGKDLLTRRMLSVAMVAVKLDEF